MITSMLNSLEIIVMEHETLEFKKKNGIFYTPDVLGDYLISNLNISDFENTSILDPAYGEGSLLLALERYLNTTEAVNVDLFGCDKHPVNGLLQHLPKANLIETDFFDYSISNKHNFIITNPPYIRRENQEKDILNLFLEENKEFKILGKKADLWAYFLMKSVMHLSVNGGMCAIIPWSFIQADYAKNLRCWLHERFGEIKVLTLSKPYFEHADERVVLLWCKGFGNQNNSVSIAFSDKIRHDLNYFEIQKETWISDKIVSTDDISLIEIFNKLKNEYGFQEFRELVDVRIGVVTGANKFFIRSFDELAAYGFTKKHLLKIITSAAEFSDYIKEGDKSLKYMVHIHEDVTGAFEDFIKEGVANEFDQRQHCENRNNWYSINVAKTPDAFFPYRVSRMPYLLINKNYNQSTNSIHRIYFKNKYTKTQVKWLQVSMLSVYGQLSLEFNSKTYGKGMLKLEPTALGKSLALINKDDSITKVFNKIQKHLISNERDEAFDLATNFLNDNLNIPKTFSKECKILLKEIRDSRRN